MKWIFEVYGDAIIELIGTIAFLTGFVFAFFNRGMILSTIFSIISKAS